MEWGGADPAGSLVRFIMLTPFTSPGEGQGFSIEQSEWKMR